MPIRSIALYKWCEKLERKQQNHSIISNSFKISNANLLAANCNLLFNTSLPLFYRGSLTWSVGCWLHVFCLWLHSALKNFINFTMNILWCIWIRSNRFYSKIILLISMNWYLAAYPRSACVSYYHNNWSQSIFSYLENVFLTGVASLVRIRSLRK